LPPQGEGASEGERPQPPFGPLPQGEGASEGERPQPPFGLPPQGEGAPEGSLLAAAPALSEREIGERAQSLFASYGCKDAAVVGRAERRGVACFEVEFSDGEGRPYTALLTERGGYLAFLDGHEDCSRLLFDRDACVEAARKFLDGCGYAGLVPVWATEGGSECRVEFVPEEEGVLLYTDRVMVKVCRGRGEVTGLDARLYLRCHKERAFAEPAVARETVEANAARRMDLLGVRAALIPRAGRELLCWEVRGTAGGRLYYAYVDAATGETAEIRTVCADGMLH
ncbi:MAG TPA: germination protein YpeB, partial [Candidatus Borkfalkia faecigallinarum]|nr:germination protein YpeB [Candidatus Borkfalkia faecigallinarum]